jgi:hypothetical protein
MALTRLRALRETPLTPARTVEVSLDELGDALLLLGRRLVQRGSRRHLDKVRIRDGLVRRMHRHQLVRGVLRDRRRLGARQHGRHGVTAADGGGAVGSEVAVAAGRGSMACAKRRRAASRQETRSVPSLDNIYRAGEVGSAEAGTGENQQLDSPLPRKRRPTPPPSHAPPPLRDFRAAQQRKDHEQVQMGAAERGKRGSSACRSGGKPEEGSCVCSDLADSAHTHRVGGGECLGCGRVDASCKNSKSAQRWNNFPLPHYRQDMVSFDGSLPTGLIRRVRRVLQVASDGSHCTVHPQQLQPPCALEMYAIGAATRRSMVSARIGSRPTDRSASASRWLIHLGVSSIC